MNEHTVRAFDDEIDRLRGMISEMGGRAEAAIAGSLRALVKHDSEIAEKVVADDKLIDALEDDDDVQTVWGNYDVPEDVLAKL